MIAIGSGERTGRGDSASQTELQFLPERHTDFIFAVIGERFGFMGAAFVLSLYALLIWRMLRVLTLSKNLYGTLIAGGIAAMLMFQILVNVGMTRHHAGDRHHPAPDELWGLVGAGHLPGDRSPAEHPFASAAGLPQQGANTTVALSRREHIHTTTHRPESRTAAVRPCRARRSRKGKS